MLRNSPTRPYLASPGLSVARFSVAALVRDHSGNRWWSCLEWPEAVSAIHNGVRNPINRPGYDAPRCGPWGEQLEQSTRPSGRRGGGDFIASMTRFQNRRVASCCQGAAATLCAKLGALREHRDSGSSKPATNATSVVLIFSAETAPEISFLWQDDELLHERECRNKQDHRTPRRKEQSTGDREERQTHVHRVT